MPIEQRPLFALLDDAAIGFPGTIATDFLGRTQTYRALADLVARAACGLQLLGVSKGSKVGLLLPNCPYYVVCFFAILKAGGTVVNYSPLDAEHQLLDRIEDSGTDILITLDAGPLLSKVTRIAGESRLRRVVVCSMADILPFPKSILFRFFTAWRRRRNAMRLSFSDLVANDGRYTPIAIDPDRDLAALQFTGGTTGTPKGAALTHANLYANAVQVAHWFTAAKPGEERILAVLPLSHAFGVTGLMNLAVALAGTLVLLPRFQPRAVLKTIQRTRATLFVGVPTIFKALTDDPRIGDFDLSSLRVCVSGGDVLPADIGERFEMLTGCALTEGYGLTECSPVVACNPFAGRRKRGSVGLPLPGTTVEILSAADGRTVLPADTHGEICVSGPQVMQGYWNRPGETAAVLQQGRLHTGDIGYLDPDGYLHFVDRAKDVIVTGGYNVYPRYVEEAILRNPDVAEVAVIGVPDPHWGHSALAYIVRAVGADLSEDELRRFLKSRLSPFEIPDRIEFRDHLPKSAIGKPLRRALRPRSGSAT